MNSNDSYIQSFDGEKLYTKTIGNSKKSKHTFIFIHGLGGDSNVSEGVINQLLEMIQSIWAKNYFY